MRSSASRIPCCLLFHWLPTRSICLGTGSKSFTTSHPMTFNDNNEIYRSDGVRITHDPYAPGMAEKYGTPGNTDGEGFDPYRDSVGPGIYGGIVKRNAIGEIVIGQQYQNHNPRPGPVYAGGGYAPSTLMLEDVDGKVIPLLKKFPDLVNDVTTGGAQPLHMCGMSTRKQHAVKALVERGADIEALDTYGMTPLHRMASNNLATGAKLLLDAGADLYNVGLIGQTAMSIASDSAAYAVLDVLKEAEAKALQQKFSGSKSNIVKLTVTGSVGFPEVDGEYFPKDPSIEIPTGFSKVCEKQGWNTELMWSKLNGMDSVNDVWFAHSANDSYIYWNKSDSKWWIDGPDGNGVWITKGPSHAPPAHNWKHVDSGNVNLFLTVSSFRTYYEKKA